MSEHPCALCSDAPAETVLEPKNWFGVYVAQETRADLLDFEVRIPLCQSCANRLTSLLDKRRSARSLDETERVKGLLELEAKRLNITVIEDASE